MDAQKTRKNAEPSAKPQKPAAMNSIWLGLMVSAIVIATFYGKAAEITRASFDAAKSAVELAIGLIGAMSLWLGLMHIAEKAGLMQTIALKLQPLMTKLFPDIPAGHPSLSEMAMNMAANILGLGNAATPLGIKAMQSLNRLNARPGEATDAMCMFLAINTSSITLLPLGMMSVRAAAGSQNPAAILIPTLLATSCSTLAAVTTVFLLKRLSKDFNPSMKTESENSPDMPLDDTTTRPTQLDFTTTHKSYLVPVLLITCFVCAAIWNLLHSNAQSLTDLFVPALMLCLLALGYAHKVPVYEAAIEGAKEGFHVAVRILPFLVMILVAVAMFRASGAFDLLQTLIAPITNSLGIPVEAVTVAILRTLSGSGAFGLVSEITARDPNGFTAFLAATIQGSTETTFYVLAVYFGAVGVYRPRHALPAALMADLAGFLASVAACKAFY
ncbi:MAG: nucleoside recognition domain-containing protein [Dissulfuribacterales bacterium]